MSKTRWWQGKHLGRLNRWGYAALLPLVTVFVGSMGAAVLAIH
jgi:hypothetical protein